MFVGFMVVLASMATLHGASAWVSRKVEDGVKIVNRVFGFGYLILVVGFVMAFLWTGRTWNITTGKQQGQLDTVAPGQLPMTTGKNSPEVASERLADEADESQAQSMEDLDDFRNKMLTNTKIGGNSEESE